MVKPQIITPVLKFWGFKQHPFDDIVLRDIDLRLFIGRKEELLSLHNALSSHLIGIYGTQGAGKSSFLRKFQTIIPRSGPEVVFIPFTSISEEALYREILSSLLTAIKDKSIKIHKNLKLNCDKELERLNFSISATHKTEVGAELVFSGKYAEETVKHIDKHTENSACVLIRHIILNTQTAFVVIIDDLERVKYYLKDEKNYLRYLSGFTQTINDLFTDQSVAFILTLDEQFVKLINKEQERGNGAFGFSFGKFIELKNFTPQELIEFIGIRLIDVKWNKLLSDFLSVDAFWTLLAVTGGHARKSLRTLQFAMEYVANNKKRKILDVNSIIEGLKKGKVSIDEKNIVIVKWLASKGPGSSSDEDFQKAVNLKRRALSERLKILKNSVNLNVSTVVRGTSEMNLYSLIDVKFDI